MGRPEQFFHVDRDGVLSAGAVLGLRPAQLGTQAETTFINQFLPGGLCPWGEAMLGPDPPLIMTVEGLDNNGLARRAQIAGETGVWLDQTAQHALRVGRNRLLEAVAEVVRQGHAPDKPSRLSCSFVYRALDAAEMFRVNSGCPNAPIWLVEPESAAIVHDGDSSWLGIPETTGMLIQAMLAYWDGATRPQSLPTDRETLLPTPVTVIRRVAY